LYYFVLFVLFVLFCIICITLYYFLSSDLYSFLFHVKLAFLHTYPPMKMEETECSETSAYKIQTPGNYPEENLRHSEQGKSLKSRKSFVPSGN